MKRIGFSGRTQMLNPTPTHARYALRPAVNTDEDFLWSLKVATLKPYIEKLYGWDEDHARSVMCKMMHKADIILVDGEPAGVLKVVVENDFVELSEIGLVPEHQGQGLGTRIIQDVLDFADQQSLDVELQVFSINPASRLYERLGFKETHKKMCRRYACEKDCSQQP